MLVVGSAEKGFELESGLGGKDNWNTVIKSAPGVDRRGMARASRVCLACCKVQGALHVQLIPFWPSP